ncbi:MAG: tRNA (N6-isopentenyl adenosine(37)-C2)-methylthiotransferase MiaB [Alphaproteobacteria bacterium]|nr:tRNA (N6-isopentenyl adenosine(37)-C2)-methylthiotransferase MiaB [Alphaproteobacteria bacterium]
MAKKLYIKTYGCQMNAYDSVRMSELLAPMGYEQTDAPDHADLVILNTCHIREKAAEKVYSDLGRMRDIKQSRPEQKMLIGVAGCVAQAEGEEIVSRAPYVDLVVGPQSYQHLPNLIRETIRSNTAAINLAFPEISKFDQLTEATLTQGSSAFVSIQEGCDKFCTFCVVPYTRGAEYSRSVRDVLEETRKLVDLGAIEITLLGQNVNAYHGIGMDGKEWGLGKLIREVAKIQGIKRIRYTTSHPNDVDDELIAAHGDIEILMPMLHLPVQSGSNKILKAMNRKHTASDYLVVIEKLRAARPDIQFSSDFIVGFPGETDTDFEDTLRLVETVGFTQGYSFKFSPRPGTPAAEKAQQVEEAVLDARLQTLQNLLAVQQEKFNKTKLGTTLSVLFNREGRLEGQMQGRSPFMQSVYVDNGAAYANRLVDVHITGAYANSLKGEVISTSQRLNPQQERVAHYG